jgi:hypothetical protein
MFSRMIARPEVTAPFSFYRIMQGAGRETGDATRS